jgi:hypothetical protein
MPNVNRALTFVVVVFLEGLAAAQSIDGFYLGTLSGGGRTLNVAVTLDTEGRVVTGSYFYFGPSEGSLDLKGTLRPDQSFQLEESSIDDRGRARPSGTWTGKVTGEGLQGTWSDARRTRQWAFRLAPADRAAAFDGAPQTRESGSGPLTFRMARVPESEHRVPVITGFQNRRAMNAVNATVFAEAGGAHCAGMRDGFDFEAAVSFVGADLLSVRITESWFCGAAYPTTGADRSAVFDLRSAQQVQLEDVFGEQYDRQRVLPVLFAYELSRSRDARPAAPNDEDCREHWTPTALLESGLDPYFHLTEEGVVVRLDVPHVIANCANDVTVPYAAVASIAAPGNPLARLLALHAGKPLRYRIHRPGTEPAADVIYTPAMK